MFGAEYGGQSELELKNRYHAARTRRVSAARLAPTSGQVVTQSQSGCPRPDSPVRILYAQPASPVSTGQKVKSARGVETIPSTPRGTPRRTQSRWFLAILVLCKNSGGPSCPDAVTGLPVLMGRLSRTFCDQRPRYFFDYNGTCCERETDGSNSPAARRSDRPNLDPLHPDSIRSPYSPSAASEGG